LSYSVGFTLPDTIVDELALVPEAERVSFGGSRPARS
jgi:hypothetical protein